MSKELLSQVDQIGLGRTDSTQDLLKLDFEYEGPNPTIAIEDKNNGSMRKQTITVPTVGTNSGFTATQTYTYDNLNRIKVAEETISGPSWKQTFDYDIYGNRTFIAAQTTTLGTCPTAVCNPAIGGAKNQITSSGYLYDAAGSLTQDAAGQRFVYDAENRQKSFFAASNNTGTPSATYAYYGEGRRVKKFGGGEDTIFVYDAAGRLAAESNYISRHGLLFSRPYLNSESPGLPILRHRSLPPRTSSSIRRSRPRSIGKKYCPRPKPKCCRNTGTKTRTKAQKSKPAIR